MLTVGPSAPAGYYGEKLYSYLTKEPIKSKVWNTSEFPDFNEKDNQLRWENLTQPLLNEISFDGLWLDMNEVTTTCDGECPDQAVKNLAQSFLSEGELGSQVRLSKDWYLSYNSNDKSTYYLPFIPGKKNLDAHTLSLNATNVKNENQRQWHSLFGIQQTKVLDDAMKKIIPNRRSFVSSRSTFASSGKFGHHVLGSHFTSISHMEYAIAGVMNFNLFGIPSAGPNVCNPSNSADWEKECASWM